MANSFFKNGDKAYSENLNDGVLVGNAFDWTVSIGLPADNGGVFPNSSTVVKAKVADVYITPNSNLSIGSSIENSSGSSQVYRLTVYPDFNRFGGFQSITLTGDATFYIANKGGTSPIANNLDYTDLSDVPELKVLKEYDIVVTIPNNGEVTGLGFVFQSSGADVSGSINQANVAGLGDRLDAIESDIDSIADLIYPVGSIYMSVNSTSPATLFGGTWEQLKDKFLLSAGDTYSAGSTGGEATHTLTTNEMPSHTHTQNAHRHLMSRRNVYIANGNAAGAIGYSTDPSYEDYITDYQTPTINSTGGGEAHNNMPPYLSVYMWKRTG